MNAKGQGPYSDKVRDHFSNPRNAGTLPNPSGKGLAKSPVDSDTVQVTLKIHDNQIEDIRFKCMGCAVAIACSSVATEMVMGRTVEEAYALTKHSVAEALDGIPEYKMICSNLASEAIRNAIDDWRSRLSEKKETGGG
jgi:nitrogen fixation NifU-like protein